MNKRTRWIWKYFEIYFFSRYFNIIIIIIDVFYKLFFVKLYNPSGTLLSTPIFRGYYTQWATPVTQSDFVNKWIFLNYVYNGGDKSTATSYVSYLNGVQLPTGTINNGPANGGLASNCNIIGVDGDNGCNSINSGLLQGKISLYKLYNRALTAVEVLQNYNATKSRFGL